MNDHDKAKEQLVAELAEMQRRVAELEALETARTRADEALRKSEERYRSFVQSFPGIAYRGRIDFSVVFFHGAVEEITGYSEHDFTSGKLTWDQVICPEDFARLHDSIEKVRLVPNYSTEREYRILRKDGETCWIHDVIHNICDTSGKPAYVQGVVYDVTDRKQAEEALEESEQWARCVFEIVPLGITECTLGGALTRTNPAYEEMLGYSSDELAGKPIVDLLEDGPGKGAFPAYLKHLASEQPTPTPYLCRDITKDGRHIDVQVNWTYKRNGQREVTGFVSVLSDITEKKRAEVALRESEQALREAHEQLEQRVKDRTAELQEANQRLEQEIEERQAVQVSLQESEERYKTLVETAPDAVVMADLEGRIAFASPRALELLGYDRREELHGRSLLDLLVEEEHQRFMTSFRERGILRDVQYSFRRRNGTEFAGELSCASVNDASGKLVARVAVARDITERKAAEEAVWKEQEALRQMLRAQDRERQLVAYEIHDGLAQQLTSAKMQFETSEQLRNENPQQASDCYSAGLYLLKKSVAEARRLISGLRPPILDEEGIVAALVHLIHDVMVQNGPEVEFHSSVTFERLEPLIENAIFRIVQESLTNVCRHSKSDRAEIRLVQDGEHVRVEVRDWGVGFDQNDVEEGCFGLAGIRERARVLGGWAAIESTPGQGTVVRAELPVMESK